MTHGTKEKKTEKNTCERVKTFFSLCIHELQTLFYFSAATFFIFGWRYVINTLLFLTLIGFWQNGGSRELFKFHKRRISLGYSLTVIKDSLW